MVGEGILYCCLSKRRNGIGTEANINAGGCNFNSFLRRAVRFVGGFQMLLTKKSLLCTFSFYHADFLLWNSVSEQCRADTGICLFLPENARRNCQMEQQSSSTLSSAASTLCFSFPLPVYCQSLYKNNLFFLLCPPWAGFLLMVSAYSFPCLSSLYQKYSAQLILYSAWQ